MTHDKLLIVLAEILARQQQQINMITRILELQKMITSREDFLEAIRDHFKTPSGEGSVALMAEELEKWRKDIDELPDDANLQTLIDYMRWPDELKGEGMSPDS